MTMGGVNTKTYHIVKEKLRALEQEKASRSETDNWTGSTQNMATGGSSRPMVADVHIGFLAYGIETDVQAGFEWIQTLQVDRRDAHLQGLQLGDEVTVGRVDESVRLEADNVGVVIDTHGTQQVVEYQGGEIAAGRGLISEYVDEDIVKKGQGYYLYGKFVTNQSEGIVALQIRPPFGPEDPCVIEALGANPELGVTCALLKYAPEFGVIKATQPVHLFHKIPYVCDLGASIANTQSEAGKEKKKYEASPGR